MKNLEDSEDIKPLRQRWPVGFWGWFRYVNDHLIFSHKRPVDWGSLHAIEEGNLHGHMVFDGGFTLLTDDEYAIFQALGKGLEANQIINHLRMPDEMLQKHLLRMMNSLGADSIMELAHIAARHVRT